MAQAASFQLLFHGTNSQALLSVLLPPLLLLLLLRCLVATCTRRRSARSEEHLLPPSPPALPVIGHMHLVGRSNPHVSLSKLAGAYGGDGLMLLRLGQVPNLVVSSPRSAEAVMRTHDHVFATRPWSAAAHIVMNGSSDVALAPYGEYWRQARRLVTAHLLSARKVQSFRRAREEEARLVLGGLRGAAAARAAVDMSELLHSFVNDVVCRAVSGKFFRAEGRHKLFRELLEGHERQLGGFNLEDYFPGLAKVGLLARLVCAKTSSFKKRWDDVLDVIIREHADADANGCREEDHRDFVDVLLSLRQEFNLTLENVKAILIDMFAAGTGTSYIVLEFAMAELIRKPHIMAKLQAEVRKHTPKSQKMVTEDDLNNMSYLKAVIKETLRLYPPVPLLLPRLSMEKCCVNGYMIPAETRVIVNAWALGRDAKYWEEAKEFMPERFIDSDINATVDFNGRDFQFVPFGAGRRICPGMNFGITTVKIMLANLMYCFDWELPAGMKNEDVAMTDVFGLTVRRKEKLLPIPSSHESIIYSTT